MGLAGRPSELADGPAAAAWTLSAWVPPRPRTIALRVAPEPYAAKGWSLTACAPAGAGAIPAMAEIRAIPVRSAGSRFLTHRSFALPLVVEPVAPELRRSR